MYKRIVLYRWLKYFLFIFCLFFCEVTQGEERFIDNGDGTITDTRYALMWQKTDNEDKTFVSRQIDYANELELAGFSDWRVPTIQELISIWFT